MTERRWLAEALQAYCYCCARVCCCQCFNCTDALMLMSVHVDVSASSGPPCRS
jgi:hypothetical protein